MLWMIWTFKIYRNKRVNIFFFMIYNNSIISNNDEEEDNLPNLSNMNDDFIIDKMKEKLEIITDEYYVKNKKDNLFKDKINLSKKRKYESFENKFIKEINDILYEDRNNKNEKKYKKKKH